MSDSGIKSGFQFESYKLDKIEFSTDQKLSSLASKKDDYDVNYSFSFRDALKYTDVADKVLYVTGVKVQVFILSKEDSHEIAKGVFEITGLFSGLGTLSEKQEETLASTQGPAILFPYVRAVISQTLYNAGFAVPIMPLVNVNAMARDTKVRVVKNEE